MATIHDIARELNITASTVSRALQDHPRISDATKKAVLKIAQKLNYQPNHLAAALRNGRSKIIGIIVPTIDRSFFGSIIRGFEEVANKARYSVMICQSHDDYEMEVATVEALLNSRVDGIICSFAKTTENFDHFRKAKNKGIPVVLFDRSNPDLEVSHVVIDNHLGAYKAVEHLIQQGCKRIGHITSRKKVSIYKERLRGYKDALEANNISYQSEYVVDGDLQYEDGRAAMEKLLSLPNRPDGIFSASAYGAVGALDILKERAIRVPDEVAIVGFDNESFTRFNEPPISTVDQQSLRIGIAAAELFLEQMGSNSEKFIPKKIVLTPDLIIRRSSLRNQPV